MKKNIIKNNSALAGVIEALLLVGLVAIILSTIQLVYIPEIMKQRENDHVDDVENQFAHLKSVVETQSMLGVMESGDPISHSPISSPITLGSDKMPYFITAQTTGYIEIIDDEKADENSRIVFNPPISTYETDPGKYKSEIPLTCIKYDMNSMYLDYDVKYVFEGGGLILNQTGVSDCTGEVTRVNPAMTVENVTGSGEKIIINYYIPIFLCETGKDVTETAIYDAYIRTNYSNHYETSAISPVTTITIYSEYLEGWYNFLMGEEKGLLWDYANPGLSNKYIDVEYIKTGDPRIEITKSATGTKDIYLDLRVIEIGVQTGTGTVIN